MQQTLQPIATIPLEATPAGEWYTPSLDLSPDGTVLYVRQPVTVMHTLEKAKWHAPDIAAIVLPAALLWMLWKGRRVLSRPQERGRAYCRVCNYELTPPVVEADGAERWRWGAGDAKCSECGSRAARGPIAGRTRRRRLLPGLAIGLTLVIASIVALTTCLEPLRPMEGPTWPMEGIERYRPGLAFQRIHHRLPTTHRITRWSVPGGRRLGELAAAPVRGSNNGLLSPDGRVYALGLQKASDLHQGSVLLIDTASGQSRPLPGVRPASVQVLAFSRDSRRLFVQADQTPTPWSGKPSTALIEIDVGTLQSRTITEQTFDWTQGRGGRETPFARYIARDDGGWALAVLWNNSNSGTVTGEVRCDLGGGVRSFPFSAVARSFHEPRWGCEDMPGDAIEIPLFGVPVIERIDLNSGAATTLPAPQPGSLGTTPDGRLEAVGSSQAPWQISLLDRSTGAVAANLSTGNGRASSRLTFTPDGRYAVGTVYYPRPGAAPGTNRRKDFESSVWIWEIKGVP